MFMFETKKELREALYNADQRCGIHFEKLLRINNIIKNGDENKEPYYFVVEQIKNVLDN